MGVHIYLLAKREDFPPELWERTYNESLVLLENFPARLMRSYTEEFGGEKRYVYASEIVRKRGTSDEHWIVSGDMTSLQRAEAFELYRHHARQFPGDHFIRRPANDRDVLWAEPGDGLDYFHGNGTVLWNSKTQGCPYHLALLAVGMLVESRCPRAACVIGDIDRHDAEQVALWANALLEEPIDLPVCVDPDRLYRRLFNKLIGAQGRPAPTADNSATLGERTEPNTYLALILPERYVRLFGGARRGV